MISLETPFSTCLDLDPREIDLGKIADLKIEGAQIGKIHENVLVPGFKTYNIAREFGVKWTVELEVGGGGGPGRIEKVKGEVQKGGIKVVGIADSIRETLGLSVGGTVGEVDVEALTGKDTRRGWRGG